MCSLFFAVTRIKEGVPNMITEYATLTLGGEINVPGMKRKTFEIDGNHLPSVPIYLNAAKIQAKPKPIVLECSTLQKARKDTLASHASSLAKGAASSATKGTAAKTPKP